MAISYDFEIAAAVPARQVAEVLDRALRDAGLLDAPVAPQDWVEEGGVTGRGTAVQVFEEHPQPWHPVVTDLGITPTVSVSFRLDKFGDVGEQQDDMVVAVDALLGAVPGDALLEYQSETIWLLRRGGDLALSEDDELWPRRRLALLHRPYRRATHSFSED
ncbi:SitI3 family protein [Streptomyces fuscigenes]|uniref:SitI3 family protein n=1 Tax=Streptomyces fuscigenes TaxID=1528880 RepID=UPI001EEB124A|nr:SitI3 family protein [Streptomyces fuscigenes]MCF3961070.1 hypothetical protein [Streptomyces fuscigenes]